MTEAATPDPQTMPSAGAAPAADEAGAVHIPPTTRRLGPTLLVWAIGLGVLVAGGLWLWLHPMAPPPATTASPASIATLAARLDTLTAQVTRMAETQQHPMAAAKPPDLTPELAPIMARLTALEHRPTPAAPATAPEVSLLAARLNLLDTRIKALQSLAQLAVASAALADGLPVGVIADAPPALARFAATPPPTLAGLRQDFSAAAAAARQAAQSAQPEGDHWHALWRRISGLITIRQGTHVLLGNPAAGTLAAAQADLDRGDLAGTLASLATLPPAAADAMANWRAQAQSLRAAQLALATAMAAAQAGAKAPADAAP